MIAHYTYFIDPREDARAAALDAWTPPDPLEAGGTSGTGSKYIWPFCLLFLQREGTRLSTLRRFNSSRRGVPALSGGFSEPLGDMLGELIRFSGVSTF